jgi:hypothetical protein
VSGEELDERTGKMKSHQPRLRVVAWVPLCNKLRSIRLRFPHAHWGR